MQTPLTILKLLDLYCQRFSSSREGQMGNLEISLSQGRQAAREQAQRQREEGQQKIENAKRMHAQSASKANNLIAIFNKNSELFRQNHLFYCLNDYGQPYACSIEIFKIRFFRNLIPVESPFLWQERAAKLMRFGCTKKGLILLKMTIQKILCAATISSLLTCLTIRKKRLMNFSNCWASGASHLNNYGIETSRSKALGRRTLNHVLIGISSNAPPYGR